MTIKATSVNIGEVSASVHGDVSDQFVSAVESAYLSLPKSLRRFCESNKSYIKEPKLGIFLGRRMSDTNAYENEKIEPTIDDPRIHVDQIAGCANRYAISMSEQWLRSFFNAHALHDGDYQPVNLARVPGVFRHEMGHFVDRISGSLSENHNFRNAWLKDVERNGGIDTLRAKGHGYYVQDDIPDKKTFVRGPLSHLTGIRGGGEVFAEAFAHYHGGGIQPRLYKIFPETFNYVEYILGEFYQAIALQDNEQHKFFGRWAGCYTHPEFYKRTDEKVAKKVEECGEFLRNLGGNCLVAPFYDYVDFIRRTAPTQANNLIFSVCCKLAHQEREKGFLSRGVVSFLPHLKADNLEPDQYVPKFRELIDSVNEIELEQDISDTKSAIDGVTNWLGAMNCPNILGKFRELVDFIEDGPFDKKRQSIQIACQMLRSCSINEEPDSFMYRMLFRPTDIDEYELEDKAATMMENLVSAIRHKAIEGPNCSDLSSGPG